MINEITSKHGPDELIPKLKGNDFSHLITDDFDRDYFFKENKIDLETLDVDVKKIQEQYKKILEAYR